MTTNASNPQQRTYAIVPQGRAEVEIMAASIGDVPWKVTAANPTGECLKLRLSAGRETGFVFVDVPRDCKWMVRALGTALGIQPGADGMVTLPDAHELVGRTVAVEIKHFQTKRGETKAGVAKWLPATSVPQRQETTPTLADALTEWERDDRQERRPSRSPVRRSRNAVPHLGADDDIPF